MNTYLFDFDGTLVDSMPTYVSLMLRILDENNIPYGDDLVKIITPLGFTYTAKYFVEMGLDMEETDIIALMNKYAVDAYSNTVPAKDGVIETLKELKARGCDLNVLTASPHTTLDPCLKRLGIFDMFTNVWSCEDFGITKSDTKIYELAAEKIGKPVQEIIFLDDNFNADKTAKEAGMTVYGVYDDSSKEFEKDIRAITDKYIYNFKELL